MKENIHGDRFLMIREGNKMSLKKQLIKNYIKMQLISSTPGELHIKIGNLPNISKEYYEFAPYVYQFIKLQEGIQDIQANFSTGEVAIFYSQTLQPQQVIMWINTVVDVAIDHMDFIADKWDTDREDVLSKLNDVLLKKRMQIS